MPGIAGEPYYSGYQFAPGTFVSYSAEGGTERDSLYNRSSMYGNFLSGGLGGHIYGADGIWQANMEPEARVKMWDAFPWESGAQVKYLRTLPGAMLQSSKWGMERRGLGNRDVDTGRLDRPAAAA
jgi:hypothetical protein